jgi:DNA-directed RNA polymerase subunit H (RpoH/RPB5)
MTKKIDITQHILVPKHTKISEKEKKQILDKYKITINELPRISEKDSAIAHLKVNIGDVIKIERNSPVAGKVQYYRCVVNG